MKSVVPKLKVHILIKCVVGLWAIVGLAIAISCWWFFPLGFLFGDGPFHGTPTNPITNQEPDQTKNIWGGNTLQVFDATNDGMSPTVQLRRADGSIEWSILADGHQAGDVKSLRFDDARRGWFRSGIVHATVDWSYGRESAKWVITGNGNLRDYWYTW